MPYNFVSGNSETASGRLLAKFWEDNTKEKLYAPYSVIGIIDKSIVGAALFTEYTGSNIDLHFVGRGCINKTVIKVLLNYIFNELKCNVVRAKLHSTEPKIIDYIQRLGFVYEHTLDSYYNLEDHAILYKMNRKDAAKWIKLDGRTNSSSP